MFYRIFMKRQKARRPVSSRLARSQGKKIARQSAGMIFFSITGLLVFLFILMPRIIDIFFRFLGTGDISFKEVDTVAPQIPIVLPIPESTQESSISIEGYGEAASLVVIINNGESIEEVVVDDEGSFQYDLVLEEGENKLGFYGKDETENESDVKEIYVNLDTEAPSLELENITDGQEILSKENQNYSIQGSTEAYSKLHINDRSVYVNSEGSFKSSYYLKEGDNTLKFIVEDKAGNITEQEFTVRFRY